MATYSQSPRTTEGQDHFQDYIQDYFQDFSEDRGCGELNLGHILSVIFRTSTKTEGVES